jgi:hypothetical protein
VPKELNLELRKRSERLSSAVLGLLTLVTALILVAVGVVTHKSHATFSVIALSVGASLLAAVMFSTLDLRTSRREFIDMNMDLGEQVIKLVRQSQAQVLREVRSHELANMTNEDERKAGLFAFFPSDKDLACELVMKQIVETSETLTLVMNYGRDWLRTHEDDLRARFLDPTKTTRFYTPALDSPTIGIQSEKQGCSEEQFRSKQTETYRTLLKLCPSDRQDAFEVRGHRFFHPYLLVFGEAEAVLVPLYVSQGKKKCVAMWLKDDGTKDSMHSRLRQDVENLHASSVDLRDLLDSRLQRR